MTTSIDEALAFEPPSREEVEESLAVLRWYFSPEKFYFSFGRPIPASQYAGKADEEAVLKRIRRQTARSIEKLLAETMLHRAQSQGDTSLWRQLLRKT